MADPGSNNKSSNDEKNSKRYLLILDINGLLCQKIFKSDCDKDKPVSYQYETLELGKFYVCIRPDVKSFLEKCFGFADVAFWSSTTHYNAKHIIYHILTKSQQSNAVFKWYRDRTKLDPSYGTDPNINESDTIKDLNDVWNNPVINRNRIYDSSNTVICDDDPQKVRLNNKDNVIVIETFDPLVSEYDNTVMDGIFDKIKQSLLTEH